MVTSGVILQMADTIEYNQGDLVRLLTTKHVSYLSHPPDETITPEGTWLVAGGVAGDLLLTKGSATIRIPGADVQMYMKRDRSQLNAQLDDQLRRVLDGERTQAQG
jgi:hypothetical protein